MKDIKQFILENNIISKITINESLLNITDDILDEIKELWANNVERLYSLTDVIYINNGRTTLKKKDEDEIINLLIDCKEISQNLKKILSEVMSNQKKYKKEYSEILYAIYDGFELYEEE